MAEVTYAKANRSFGSIRQGEVVEIGQDDARGQAYLAAGYLTVVTDGKGAKKVKPGDLEDKQQWDTVVWTGGVSDGVGFDGDSIKAKAGQPVTGDSTAALKSTPVAFTSESAAETPEKKPVKGIEAK